MRALNTPSRAGGPTWRRQPVREEDRSTGPVRTSFRARSRSADRLLEARKREPAPSRRRDDGILAHGGRRMNGRDPDKTRILLPDDVRRLLRWDVAIDAMRAMFRDLGGGRAGQPSRFVMPGTGEGGALGVMPSWARPRGRERPVMAVKAVSVFTRNRARGL